MKNRSFDLLRDILSTVPFFLLKRQLIAHTIRKENVKKAKTILVVAAKKKRTNDSLGLVFIK
jgi:hypothetical protein